MQIRRQIRLSTWTFLHSATRASCVLACKPLVNPVRRKKCKGQANYLPLASMNWIHQPTMMFKCRPIPATMVRIRFKFGTWSSKPEIYLILNWPSHPTFGLGRRRLRDQAPSRMEISTRRSRHISDVIVEVINSNSHILIDICRIKYLKAKSKLHLVWYITTQWQPKVMSTGEHFRIYLC